MACPSMSGCAPAGTYPIVPTRFRGTAPRPVCDATRTALGVASIAAWATRRHPSPTHLRCSPASARWLAAIRNTSRTGPGRYRRLRTATNAVLQAFPKDWARTEPVPQTHASMAAECQGLPDRMRSIASRGAAPSPGNDENRPKQSAGTADRRIGCKLEHHSG